MRGEIQDNSSISLSWLRPLLPLLLVVIVTLSFSQAYSFGFINFDDNIYIYANRNVVTGWSLENLLWAITTTHGGHWHPLTWAYHILENELFGVVPSLLHVTSVLWHSINSLLLYLLILILIKDRRIAFFSACIFAVHPLRIESVVWLSQKKDLLSLFFALSSVILFLRYSELKREYLRLLALFLFLFGLLSKPTIITLPILLLVIVAIKFRPNLLGQGHLTIKSVRKFVSDSGVMPFLVVALIFSVAAIYSQSVGGGLRSNLEVPIGDRVALVATGFLAYLGKLFWPSNLTIFYPIVSYPSGIAAGALLGIFAIWVTLVRARKSYPELLTGAVLFSIAILPMLGIVTVGGQAFADRWSMLPHIGLITGIVMSVFRIAPRYGSFLSSFFVISLITATQFELPNWRGSEELFRRSLAINSENFLAHTNLGVALGERGEYKEQVYHYEEAVRLNPTYPEGLNNLGVARMRQRRFIEGLELFERALKINPDFDTAKKNRDFAIEDIERARR